MPVKIHNKEYQTVAERIAKFRDAHPEMSINSDIVQNTEAVIIKTSIIDVDNRTLATGYAEEVRGSSNINKTSALENCETSAVGRALAFLGYGGEQIASANEVSSAAIQQAEMEHIEYMRLVRDSFDEIWEIKNGIAANELNVAAETYRSMDKSLLDSLWKAPTKGGVFSTKEREVISSDEFAQALREVSK